MGKRKQASSSEPHVEKPVEDTDNLSDRSSPTTPDDSDEMREEFHQLFLKYRNKGLTGKQLKNSRVLKAIDFSGSSKEAIINYALYIIIALSSAYLLIVVNCLLSWPISNETINLMWFRWYGMESDIETEECSVYLPEVVSDIFRPPLECSFCKDVKEVKTVYNISQEEFEELYAYSGVPVVIGDGTTNWTAPQYFSFGFFKSVYADGSQALIKQQQHCQFFPYKTDFKHLGEVFEMSEAEALMQEDYKPWYIGWSNCDFSTANMLRSHYKRPYFLPKLSESSKTDWIFMGSPGYGAHLHIDYVDKPSWQAQITGTKRWTLEPPPECYYVCEEKLEVTVRPGQIIVLDTNIWFHSTLNIGDDISITIGSEYD